MSVVAVGACYVDTILTTPYYPSEDEKLRATSISRRRGGNCPNTLEVLQQLTPPSTPGAGGLNLVAVLPAQSSVTSKEIQSAFEPCISLANCTYREEHIEPASSYIIKSAQAGSRTIVNYNDLPEMSVDELKGVIDAVGERAGWVHFEGRIPDVILEGIKYLRQRFPSVRVSVEIEKPQRPGLQELAVAADVVFYSKSWALGNGYKSAEECLQHQATLTNSASLLCCTWGEAGAYEFQPESGSLSHSPAYSAADFQVIDTIGAGDTFIAGMLYGIIWKQKQWDVQKRLGFANRIAGMKVAQEGFGGLARALDGF